MQQMDTSVGRRLLRWGVAVVGAHFLLVLWHLLLLLTVEPNTPRLLPPILILINLLPLAGLLAYAKGFSKSAAILIALPLAVGLAIGGYSHFLSPGTDNVFRMPPGEFRLSFQVSALLLVILEASGCWIALRMFVSKNSGSPMDK